MLVLAGCSPTESSSQQSSAAANQPAKPEKQEAPAATAAPATPPAQTPPPPPSTVPPPPPSTPPEPTTMYAKAIRRAEDVSKVVQQNAASAAEAIGEAGASAMEQLQALRREDVDAWLESQKQFWGNAAAQLQEKAKQRGNDGEPAVRAAQQKLSQAREALARKATEFKSAAEKDLPRLRRELQEAWRKLRDEQVETDKVIDTTV